MTLTQLEHVLSAHIEGTFSRAARACGITQAAISNSIAKLEEELGERVFARSTRRVALTPFGKRLVPYIEQILAGRDALLDAVKSPQAKTTTVLGHSPLIPPEVLTRIVGSIRGAGLGAEIRLVEENLEDLFQRLAEHTVDLALVPAGEQTSALRSAPVFEEPLYYVPRLGLPAKAESVELKNLGEDRFVMVPDQCGLARTTRALFASADVPLHTYAGEAMGYHVLQEWAALDLGSAILPESRLTSRSRAVPLMREAKVPATLTYRVVWHKDYERGKQLAAILRPHAPR
jgi:DNA-binding transcriptional LysR family regulator